MTDEAFKDAKIIALTNEVTALQSALSQWSGVLRAKDQVGKELFDVNINLRSSYYLLEDKLKKLEDDIKSFTERVHALEKEKSDLIAERDDLRQKLTPKDDALESDAA